MDKIKMINNRLSISLIFGWVSLTAPADDNLTLQNILSMWQNEPEKGKEILRTYQKSKERGFRGDCDDLATAIISKAKQLKKSDIKISFLVKNNNAIHVFAIIDELIYDSWQSRKPIKKMKIEGQTITYEVKNG